METTLFYIGCGLGGYALVLRQMFKREMLLSRRFLVGALHLIFMAGVGAMVGFVISASKDLHGPTPQWPLVGALAGFIWGVVQVTRTSSVREGPPQLLAADLEWVETAFSAVLLAAVIMYGLVQAFKIPSGSMEDTLLIGDHLFVNKFIYGVRVPFTEKRLFKIRDVRRGDIIVFQCPEAALSDQERERGVRKDFIKRAIGLPGDEIQFRDKKLYVNGTLQKEAYAVHKDPMLYPAASQERGTKVKLQDQWSVGELAQARESPRDNFGPVRVPKGAYFVAGDNRDMSFDSRFWGPMPNRLLKGRAWVVYFPGSENGRLNLFRRLQRVRVIR